MPVAPRTSLAQLQHMYNCAAAADSEAGKSGQVLDRVALGPRWPAGPSSREQALCRLWL